MATLLWPPEEQYQYMLYPIQLIRRIDAQSGWKGTKPNFCQLINSIQRISYINAMSSILLRQHIIYYTDVCVYVFLGYTTGPLFTLHS